jgi:hypothetical protein
MKPRRVASFIDDVLSDRRPGPFKAAPADVDVLQVAIALRAARPGDGAPEERFVTHLGQELARELQGTTESRARPAVPRRTRIMWGAAAAVSLLGGTAAATTSVDHALAAGDVRPAHAELLRVGTFTSADGHAIGEIVAYRGSPSWVFMSIRDPATTGTYDCQIQLNDGRTAATGRFVVHKGAGDWARPVTADIAQFRGASLISAAGSTLATARFQTA